MSSSFKKTILLTALCTLASFSVNTYADTNNSKASATQVSQALAQANQLSAETLAFQAKADADKQFVKLSPEQIKELKPSIAVLRENIVKTTAKELSPAQIAQLEDKLIDASLTKTIEGKEVLSCGTKLDGLNTAELYPISKVLLSLAQAYAAKPDAHLANVILTSFETIKDKYYHNNGTGGGNWWWYEIGYPRNMSLSLILLGDAVSQQQLADLLLPTKYYQPNPYYSGMTPGAKYTSNKTFRLSEGGNRTDTALVSFYRGILENNPNEIVTALNSTYDTVALVEKGNGFYKDGSFIQHDNVGYNGTYGKVLLSSLAKMKQFIAGSKFTYGNKAVNDLFDSFKKSYGYLMINGGVTDAVSGRAVSKVNPVFGKAKDSKHVYYNRAESSSDLERGQDLYSVFDVLEIDVPEQKDNKYFYTMDKLVHRNNKGGALVLSMHSNRIANYESFNGDNRFGQRTGDGFMYIYGKNSHANVGYFLDYDYHYAPGTTEADIEIKPFTGIRAKGEAMTEKSFVGGLSLPDNKQFIAFDYEPANQAISVQKSYLADDKGVFITGVSSKAKGGEKVFTTLDQRRMDYAELKNSKEIPLFDSFKANGLSDEEASKKLQAIYDQKRHKYPAQVFVDGKAVKENTVYKKAPKSLVFKDRHGTIITYNLYDLPNLSITFKNGFVIFSSDNTYKFSYGIYPQTKAPEVAPYKVLEQSADVQALKKGHNYYLNFFKAGDKVAGIKTSAPLQVAKNVDDKGDITLVVNDPSQKLHVAEVIIDGEFTLAKKLPEVIKVNAEGYTIIVIDFSKRQGESLEIPLRKL